MANYTISESFHSKKNIPIWLVKPSNRLDIAEFKKLDSAIKIIGGYYSRFVHAFVFEKEPNEDQLKEAFDENQQIAQPSISSDLIAKIPLQGKFAPVDKRTLRSEYEKGKLLVAAASYFDGMYDTERSIPDSEMVWGDKNAGFERDLDNKNTRAYVSGDIIRLGYYEAKYKPEIKPMVMVAPIKQKSINFYVDVDQDGRNKTNDLNFFTLEKPLDSEINYDIPNGTRVILALYGQKFCGKVVDKSVSEYLISTSSYGSSEKTFERVKNVSYTVMLDNGISQKFAHFKIANESDCNEPVVPAIEQFGDLVFPQDFWSARIVRTIRTINSFKKQMAARKNKSYAAKDQQQILKLSDSLQDNFQIWNDWESQNLESARRITEESEKEQKYRMEKWAKEFNVQTKAEKKSIQQKLIELNNLI